MNPSWCGGWWALRGPRPRVGGGSALDTVPGMWRRTHFRVAGARVHGVGIGGVPVGERRVLAYTLSLGDGFFSPQLAVDAYAASHALGRPSPITAAFALIGLCLYVEQGFSGRRVQLAHTQLGERRREWPRFEGPAERAANSVLDVMADRPGVERDKKKREWVRTRCVECGEAQKRKKNHVKSEE